MKENKRHTRKKKKQMIGNKEVYNSASITFKKITKEVIKVP